MPLYEYYCAECKTKFDALRPMSQADTAIQCKKCQSTRTSRTLSLFATFSNSDTNGAPQSMGGGFGGGCCGGGSCGCGH